jgi:hypothetical protein
VILIGKYRYFFVQSLDNIETIATINLFASVYFCASSNFRVYAASIIAPDSNALPRAIEKCLAFSPLVHSMSPFTDHDHGEEYCKGKGDANDKVVSASDLLMYHEKILPFMD